MTLRGAWFIAACFFTVAAAPAAAQFPPQPQQPAAQFPPVGGQQPAPQAQQSTPPCVVEFMKLRDETEKKGMAIRAASERHANPKEACGLFNTFTAAEAKLLKYATDNTVWCGIPKDVIDHIKEGHSKALEIRAKICQAANRPQAAPHQPTLSDALGAPVTDSSNIKTGRGTFDTLTGTPLGTK